MFRQPFFAPDGATETDHFAFKRKCEKIAFGVDNRELRLLVFIVKIRYTGRKTWHKPKQQFHPHAAPCAFQEKNRSG
jgi:hypothetical protein